jgi:PST family polysaccharide transporter
MSAIRSGLFSLTNQFFHLVITFGSLAILGRLLTPEDFGLFGIILATHTLFLPLLDMGLTPAYIKLKEIDQNASNAFFTLNVLLGFFITLCLIAVSPLIAIFYDIPVLQPMMIFFAISISIQSLSQQPLASLARSKRFDKTLVVSTLSSFIGVLVAIVTAYGGLGAWALIIRAHVQSIVMFFSSKLATRQTYRLVGWNKIRHFKSSIRFGGEIVVSRLIGGALLSVDKLMFGKFFNIDSLGNYTRAVQLAQMPDANIRTALSTPALAHLARHDSKTHRGVHYKIFCNIILFIAGLPCLLLIVIGDWVLPWLMGSQWIEAGIYAQILGLSALGKVMQGLSTILYMNEMQIKAWIGIIGLAFPAILAVPLSLALSGYEAIYYIIALSVGYLVYWMIVLLRTLFIFSGNFESSKQVGWTILISSFSILSIGFFLKGKFLINIVGDNLSTTIGILQVSIVSVFFVIIIHYLINRKQFFEIYNFIKKWR